jgi:hypothetical protein
MFHAFHACTVGDLAKNQSADLQSWEKLSEVKTTTREGLPRGKPF